MILFPSKTESRQAAGFSFQPPQFYNFFLGVCVTALQVSRAKGSTPSHFIYAVVKMANLPSSSFAPIWEHILSCHYSCQKCSVAISPHSLTHKTKKVWLEKRKL